MLNFFKFDDKINVYLIYFKPYFFIVYIQVSYLKSKRLKIPLLNLIKFNHV